MTQTIDYKTFNLFLYSRCEMDIAEMIKKEGW